MSKFIITILFALLSFGNAEGKVSVEAIEKEKEVFRKNVMELSNQFINARREALEKLKGMLPAGPEKVGPERFGDKWKTIERDVFALYVEKNRVAIEVLEKQIKLLKMKRYEKTKKASSWYSFLNPRNWFSSKEEKDDEGQISKTIKELSKLLESQKSITKEWDKFWPRA